MISFKNLGKMGRLGNQLFQIAATISLALKNNDQYAFPSWEYKSKFNLDHCFFDNIDSHKIYKESSFSYFPIPYSPNMDLFGFFQSEKYFIEHKNLIKDLLTPTLEHSTKENLCGIHVRRGDYVNNPAYVNLGIDYYNKAMSVINSSKYIIFSDDINWCKNNFKGSKFSFSESNDPVTDLALMAKKCEHIIMANSSFSWWGAYLNNNDNKKIIAPKNWFGNLKHDIKDLIPNEYIKI